VLNGENEQIIFYRNYSFPFLLSATAPGLNAGGFLEVTHGIKILFLDDRNS